MRTRYVLAPLLSLSLLTAALTGQYRDDTLTPKETDSLRDTAKLPEKRIKLFIDYAKARLESLESMRKDPKLQSLDGIGQMRRLLHNFTAIVDELDDNVSSYDSHGDDLRKPLRTVIRADSDFERRLRAIEANLSPDVLQQVNLELKSATDSVSESAEAARTTLEKQNERNAQKKHEKKFR